MNEYSVGLSAAASSATGEPSTEDVWRTPLDRLLARLATKPAGLTEADARPRLAAFGPNDASKANGSPLWLRFLERFRDPPIVILVVASGLSAATGDVAT